jgi:hypothetical protein
MTVLPFVNVGSNPIQYSIDTIGTFNNIFGSAVFNTLACYSNSTPIDSQSWRTITLLVKFPTQAFNTADTYTIFKYGPINVSLVINGQKTGKIVFNSTQTVGSATTVNFESITSVAENTPYYIMISQDTYNIGQTFSQYTRSLTFYANTLDKASGGYYNTTMKTFLYNSSTARGDVFNLTNSNGYQLNNLVLGSNSTNKSAYMYVGWLRVFDYVLLQSDVIIDAANTWKRNWWNLQNNLKGLSASGSNASSYSVLSNYNVNNYTV